MKEIIKSRHELCTGCNRCVRECPMETANITYQDENGNIRVRIDPTKCINCGRCIAMCKHEAREYEDDTERFIEDLRAGIPISLIVAPAIRTNIPEYKKLFTYLRSIGAGKIYDVSLGADISIWANIRHLEKHGTPPIISQPCPVIVSYCEVYRHDLLDKLSPVHSPMACVAIYMKKYEGITDRIAAISPCLAKSIEFESTKLTHYNVTFKKLQQYLEDHKVELPLDETGFDHLDSGLGALFPMPGGLKENIDFYFNNKVHVYKSEGMGVFNKLDTYSETPSELLPEVFDVLNCAEGCNVGSAVSCEQNIFGIDSAMKAIRNKENDKKRREWLKDRYNYFDSKLDPDAFTREYCAIDSQLQTIDEKDIEKAYALLGKTDYDKQHVDCSACGSATCYDMARKLALGVSIPSNCMVLAMETAKAEHEENLITHEQLATMEKLRAADERIRIMLDANPHINILFNDKFEVMDCNPAAVSFMGVDAKQTLIDNFFPFITKSIPTHQSSGRLSIPFTERFMSVVRDGYARFETDLSINGTRRTLDVTLKRIPYADSFAIVGYFYDMTAIHEREMELQLVQSLNELQLSRLDMAVRATKIALWEMEVITDDTLNPINVFSWTDEFRRLLGFDSESDFPNELSSWSDRLHPEDKTRALDAFFAHLYDTTGRTPFDAEYRLLKKNNQFAYFRATCETNRDEDGNPIRTVGALMDITETKNLLFEAEQQRIEAETASKAKSAFLSTMSHEIRTPMNAIIGITEIQLQNESLDRSVREALGKIYSSGDMLLGIINDMLDLSKIESGKLELIVDKYEIASLISDTAQLNMMRIGSKPIEFELQISEDMPSVLMGDELRVKQIMNNILSNAFKYTAEGSVVLSIAAEPPDNDDSVVVLLIKISDTGQGMTITQVNKLFDEYSRFNMETNRATEGTGLGMSITQNLISLMGGDISVTSEPGEGTTFTVRLPQGKVDSAVLGKEMVANLRQFRTSSMAQMRRTQIMREPMPYGSVLIVDDVDTNNYVTKGLLAPYGVRVDMADSGFVAIEKIQAGNIYDIVFMDHMMPQMDGLEATKIIRGLGYDRPIVALTANAVVGQADIFLNNGFDDFISKPIDVRQLNSVLNKLIRDKQPPEVINAARRQSGIKKAPSADGAAKKEKNQRYAEIFARDARKSLAALESVMEKGGSLSEEDFRKYVINVHGMKSALAAIGKVELSAIALKLEVFGRERDVKAMQSETPWFMDSLHALVEELTQNGSGEDCGTASEDLPYLRENLLTIKAACEGYDESSIESALSGLREKTWTHSTNKLLDTIAEHLLHSDFAEISETISAALHE